MNDVNEEVNNEEIMEEQKRALAYFTTVDEIRPIPNYDRVEHVRTKGWWCICPIGQFHVGDKAVYFEIDSLVPPKDPRFAFLESKHYKIKTIKMCKVYSQGLLMPLNEFPELAEKPVGYDCTDDLGVTYYVPEDNVRKSNAPDPNAKYISMAARHRNLAKMKWFRWLMKRDWGKKLLYVFFGKKKKDARGWPSFIRRTDETRVEEMPWVVEDAQNNHTKYSVSEKMDGTSVSFGVKLNKKHKYDFYVCSRNVLQKNEDQKCWHDNNIYWEMAYKYDVEKKLTHFAAINGYDTVVLQGEGIGKVQGNPYKLEENDLYCFNLVLNGTKVGNSDLCKFCDEHGFKHVPIIWESHELPHDFEELKLEADGFSVINPNVRREGLVYRTNENNPRSFKNVSRLYLLKHSGD